MTTMTMPAPEMIGKYAAGVHAYAVDYYVPDYEPLDTDLLCAFRIQPAQGVDMIEAAAAVAAWAARRGAEPHEYSRASMGGRVTTRMWDSSLCHHWHRWLLNRSNRYRLYRRRHITGNLQYLVDGRRGNNLNHRLLPFWFKVFQTRQRKTARPQLGELYQDGKIHQGQTDSAFLGTVET